MNNWIGVIITASTVSSAFWSSPKLYIPLLGPNNICTERQCRKPPTIPATLYLVVKAASPLYVSVLPKSCVNEHIDNVCYTFFDLGAGMFLLYQSVVFDDNSTALYSHIEVDVPGRLGTLRGADPTCTYQEFVLQVGCDSCFILYRCFLYGVDVHGKQWLGSTLTRECNHGVVTLEPGFDSIYAIANINKFTPSCQDSLVKQIQSIQGFNVTEHLALPNKLNNKCVAIFNGAKCIGYERLEERNSIAIDTQGDSTTGIYAEELDQILVQIRTDT